MLRGDDKSRVMVAMRIGGLVRVVGSTKGHLGPGMHGKGNEVLAVTVAVR